MDDFRLALELAKAASERESPRRQDPSVLVEIRELLVELVRLQRLSIWEPIRGTVINRPDSTGTATFPATGLILT